MDRLTLVEDNQQGCTPQAQDASQAMAAEGGEQAPELDTGLLSLMMLARFHGIATGPAQLAHEFRVPGKHFDEEALLLACKKLGRQARAVTTRPERLAKTPLPALAQTDIAVENKRVKLSPGMAVSVEVKTGKRRVMEYFLSPLMEYQSESFKER